MNIILNGEKFSIDKKTSIKDILIQNNIGEKNIVVEVNKEIISKTFCIFLLQILSMSLNFFTFHIYDQLFNFNR